MKIVITLILAIFISACSTTGTKFTPLKQANSAFGVVYVYRPSLPQKQGVAPNVYINGKEKSKLYNGGYQVYQLSPGKYEVVTDGNYYDWGLGKSATNIKVSAGKNIYIRLGSHLDPKYWYTGAAIDGLNLIEVKEDFAKKEIPQTKLSMQ